MENQPSQMEGMVINFVIIQLGGNFRLSAISFLEPRYKNQEPRPDQNVILLLGSYILVLKKDAASIRAALLNITKFLSID